MEKTEIPPAALPPPGPPGSRGLSLRLRALWAGDVPLDETFWLYFFAVTFILRLLARIGGLAGMAVTVIGIAWAGFMIVPIIRAADKYPGERIWAILARIVAALITLAVIADVMSL